MCSSDASHTHWWLMKDGQNLPFNIQDVPDTDEQNVRRIVKRWGLEVFC